MRGNIVNSAYILVGLFALLFLGVTWLTWRGIRNVIRRRNELHPRLSEPRTHGDDGGYPVIKGRVEKILR